MNYTLFLSKGLYCFISVLKYEHKTELHLEQKIMSTRLRQNVDNLSLINKLVNDTLALKTNNHTNVLYNHTNAVYNHSNTSAQIVLLSAPQ